MAEQIFLWRKQRKRKLVVEVSCEFTMQKDTDNDSKMLISMGKINGENTPASDITLTNFSLEKITE